MRPLNLMRSSKSGGKKRKKCNLSGTHSFQGKKWGKTMVRGNKPWEKISREKTKTNETPIHLKFGKKK